tara:strand:- start:190 stop:867 length:678 start_codon:yes stop_codon:yes gene_type:complete
MAFKLRSGNKSSFKSMGSSPAKGSGTEALAMSQARLNNQEYQKRLNEQVAKDNKPSKSINAITGTPLPQKKEKWESYYPLTEEEKNTPTEEELDQEKIDQQIKGTYVETEEDIKRRKEEMRKYAPRKKPPTKQIELALLRKRKGLGPKEIKGEDDQSYEAAVTRKEMGMTKEYPYYYKINGQNVSKDAYIKYKNKPGGDEPGKQTNDPDVYGRKANNHGRGKKTK